MAVTLTVDQALRACRIDDDTTNREIVTRLLGVATEKINKAAPTAPDSVASEGAVRLIGYLFDMPQTVHGTGFSTAWRNSGAYDLLSDWIDIDAAVLE